MMKAINKLILYFLIGVVLSACGAGEYLDLKKFLLKERISFKRYCYIKKDNLSKSQVKLDVLVEFTD